jgi:hypothetical protein
LNGKFAKNGALVAGALIVYLLLRMAFGNVINIILAIGIIGFVTYKMN